MDRAEIGRIRAFYVNLASASPDDRDGAAANGVDKRWATTRGKPGTCVGRRWACKVRYFGSAREFVKSGILRGLRGFGEDDELVIGDRVKLRTSRCAAVVSHHRDISANTPQPRYSRVYVA